jgi:Mrp family chromosome partitioning ATPase
VNPFLFRDFGLFAELAEAKRMCSALETALRAPKSWALMVTSAVPGEGKTTLVATLAAVAVRQRKGRVLAVDLNWHAPALHGCFGLEQQLDIDAVKGETSIENLVRPSGLDGLDVLTATKPGDRFAESNGDPTGLGIEIIEKARQCYDLVLIDASPLFRTNRRMMDPVAISKAADGTALVVLAGVTPRQAAKRACMILQTAGANVLGVIVNQWKNRLV